MQLPQEQLGSFYLGGLLNESGDVDEQPLLLDARDLTTHAICVGMTGSGKTGLCIGLLEEAALDRVPALLIDPKGDITNLLLQFPELLPEDFQPWVNVDDARRKNKSVEEYAASTADMWRNGLSDWGIDGELIQTLKNSADYTIFTPGSDAGVGVNIMGSLKAPSISFDDDAEMLRERISGMVAALLALIGENVDPVRSNEGVLLSMIFEHYWRLGVDLDLPKLILAVQNPPFEKLGVFDVETVYPSKDRTKLAMSFNMLMASPTFSEWLQGESLDIETLLFTREGKPRQSIFYLAHLTDSERMFFVTLLMESVVTWMRRQSGTTSLRALIYFDEIFGFFPPTAEPPSKRPLLTIMKQARAYGVGAVLVTQNPVDIDYKGISNAGAWFIGKLQTERDKARVLDGLKGAIAESGSSNTSINYDGLISRLNRREFLLHNIHADRPVVFQTRWVMSYLRGPLTRPQVKSLMEEAGKRGESLPAVEVAIGSISPSEPEVASAQNGPESSKSTDSASTEASTPSEEVPNGYVSTVVGLDTGIRQRYLESNVPVGAAVHQLQERTPDAQIERTSFVYHPGVVGEASVQFVHRNRDKATIEDLAFFSPILEETHGIQWDAASAIDANALQRAPGSGGDAGPYYQPVSADYDSEREFMSVEKEFNDWVYYNSRIRMLVQEDLALYQQSGESDSAFMQRVTHAAREARDAEVDGLENKYEDKIARVNSKITDVNRKIEGLELELNSRRQLELIGLGEGALGYFLNRRRSSVFSGIGSRRRMTTKAHYALETASEQLVDLQEDVSELQAELEEATSEITLKWANAVDKVETVELKPRRADVEIIGVSIAWAPHWLIDYTDGQERQRSFVTPACRIEA